MFRRDRREQEGAEAVVLWFILRETLIKMKRGILRKCRPKSRHFLVLALHLKVFQKFRIFLGDSH